MMMQTVPATAGIPGIGGYGEPAQSGFVSTQVGHHDAIAPAAVVRTSVASSLFPTSASLKWQGAADDVNGVGVSEYLIARNGTPLGSVAGAEFADATVHPSTSYTYTIQPVDYHGNTGPGTNVTIQTPGP